MEALREIPYTDGEAEGEYSRNIQVADINALNAAMAGQALPVVATEGSVGCTPRPSRNRIRLRHSKGFWFWSGAGMHTPSTLKWHWPSEPDPRSAASRMHTAYS